MFATSLGLYARFAISLLRFNKFRHNSVRYLYRILGNVFGCHFFTFMVKGWGATNNAALANS